MSTAEWQDVSDMMQDQNEDQKKIELGPYISYWMRKSPRRALHYLSYYKFAAKLIGTNKQILDVGCAEGLGSWVLAVECGGHVLGLDLDHDLIQTAQRNWQDPRIDFEYGNFLEFQPRTPNNALVSFDVIEHILPQNMETWWQTVTASLQHDGIAIIGTPSEISQQYASEISQRGHVNIYSAERLRHEMKEHFHHVFMFAAHDEVVHTGYMPLAHYQIALGCQKKL